MTSYNVNCPECGKRLQAPEAVPQGKRVSCPRCGRQFYLAKAQASAAPTALTPAPAARPTERTRQMPTRVGPLVMVSFAALLFLGIALGAGIFRANAAPAPLAPMSPPTITVVTVPSPPPPPPPPPVTVAPAPIPPAPVPPAPVAPVPPPPPVTDPTPATKVCTPTDAARDEARAQEHADAKARQVEFHELMVKGSTALGEHDFECAIDSYTKAQVLFPENVEAAKGLSAAHAAEEASEAPVVTPVPVPVTVPVCVTPPVVVAPHYVAPWHPHPLPIHQAVAVRPGHWGWRR